jgi:acetyl esterase/lipase
MYIELAWPYLWPFLERADKRLARPMGPSAILASIRSKALQGWLIYDKNMPVAGIATRLVRHTTSGELHCQIFMVGGSHLLRWADDFLSKLMTWAKAEGCSAVVAAGVRPGWERVAPTLGFVRSHMDGPDWVWEVRI